MSQQNITSIQLVPKEKEIKINVQYRVLFNNVDEGLSCHIPGFNFYYTATDEDYAGRKGDAFIKMYLDHYFLHTEKKGLNKFYIQLYRNGFRPSDSSVVLPNLLDKGVKNNLRFNSKGIVPIGFDSTRSIEKESDLTVPA